MLMIDTSVWIGVFRDRTGGARAELSTLIGEQDYTLSRFTQMELLQGSRDEQEWSLLQDYLVGQDYTLHAHSLSLLRTGCNVLKFPY